MYNKMCWFEIFKLLLFFFFNFIESVSLMMFIMVINFYFSQDSPFPWDLSHAVLWLYCLWTLILFQLETIDAISRASLEQELAAKERQVGCITAKLNF